MLAAPHSPLRFSRLPRWTALGAIVAIAGVVVLGLVVWPRVEQGTPSAAVTATPALQGRVVEEGGPPTDAYARPLAQVPLVVSGRTVHGARISRVLHSGADGRFALNLPSGRYTVTAVIYQRAPFADQPHQRVVVRPRRPVRLRFVSHVQ